MIVGGGAAGMAMVNRLARRLQGGTITLVEPRETHHYQPGWTMVASGIWAAEKTMRLNAQFLPRGVKWLRDYADSIDADSKRITLVGGETLEYDFLIVASGIQLNYHLIEGMTPVLVGQHGIGSVYAGIEGASRTNQAIQTWLQSGHGRGIFTAAPTPVKCAGAPLKMTFTTLSRLEDTGRRDAFDVDYMAPGASLFSQPWVDEFVKQRFDSQGVNRRHHYRLSAIDPQAKQAEFAFVGPESEFTSHHQLREAEFRRDD